jgi:glycosyltransferase involved in cell wall biosynthesis
MAKPFTLVTTVFNEMKRLDDTIADIEAQTLRPDEVIIIDAGSTDGTMERLARWSKESSISIRAEVMPKCNIAQGRNYAISIARNELIASTDFGCRYKPEWLESIITPFDNPEWQVVTGNFTVRESEITTDASKADWVLQNGYNYSVEGYLPSSRSIAYYRYVWEKCGKYPEWVTLAADDSTFWYVIEKLNFKYLKVSTPNVYWLRHKTYKAFEKEAWRYGLGEGETRSGLRNFFSNLIETSCRYTIPLNLLLFPFGIFPWWLHASAGVVQLFGLRSYKYAFGKWQVFGKKHPGYSGLSVLFSCFKMIEISRINHMKGYYQGYWKSPEFVVAEAKKLQTFLKG